MSSVDPLRIDPETMRELGYRTVDMLVDWLHDIDAPPLRRAAPDEMQARLSGPPLDTGVSFDEILATLAGNVLPFGSRVHHPAFFAFIPGSGTWPGALGDLVASAANLYAGSWMESAGPSQVELEVLRWFADWLGLPESAGGLLLSGGSAANTTALACAREKVAGAMAPDLVAYLPDQAHSSMARAARILGFGPAQVRVLPVDDEHRLRPRALAGAIKADVAARLRPLFVVASGGSTNTGAVDPLPELAAIAHEYGAWFHVDAAYGGFAVLTHRGRDQLAGIELADSVTLDPHKWLYQPYECGCLLVREAATLESAFAISPDYLRDSAATGGEVNFSDRGMQLTRTSRALKIWISLRYFGLDAFRAAIDRSLDLAELASRRIDESPVLELAASPSLGIVCFRRRFDEDEDERNAGLVAALERSGIGLVSSTRLRGRYAIRLCPLNHTTAPEDVERVLSFLETAEPEPGALLERDREVSGVWLRSPGVDPDELAAVPLFSSLGPPQLARVSAMARVREAARGERIVEQWTTARAGGRRRRLHRRRAGQHAGRRGLLRRVRCAGLGRRLHVPAARLRRRSGAPAATRLPRRRAQHARAGVPGRRNGDPRRPPRAPAAPLRMAYLAQIPGVFATVMRNRELRRAELAFAAFNGAEWAVWIAMLVYAYRNGGATEAGIVAFVQLVPAGVFAPLAAGLPDRLRPARVLTLGYFAQAAAMGATGAALFVEAPSVAVYALAALAATLVTITRPTQAALLPGLVRSPEELTATNVVSGWIESVAMIAAPAATGVLLAVASPSAVFVVMAALALVGALAVLPIEGPAAAASQPDRGIVPADRPPRLLVGLLGAQYVLIGALDVLFVVLAIGVLGLGSSGAGYLNAAFGAGGTVGIAATVVLLGRRHVSPPMAFGAAAFALAFVAIGLWPTTAGAFLLLVLAGAGRSLFDVAGRTLLQRTVPAQVLARMFGMVEALSMAGLAAGSLLVPALVALGGPRTACIALGALFASAAILAGGRVLALDRRARVPIVEISLLRTLPIFAPLGTPTLETLARSLEHVER